MSKKFDLSAAVAYLKGTSLLVGSFLRDENVKGITEQKAEKEVKKKLDQCDMCQNWLRKGSVTDGLCAECQDEEY